MNEDRLRALYAGAMARMPLPEEPVSLDAMMEVIERRGSEAERSQTLRRILRDPRAREEFELLRVVARAGAEPKASWKTAVAWRIAAGVLIMAGAAWLFSINRETAEPMRGGGTLFVNLLPRNNAEVPFNPLFIWRSVPQAVDYRLEIIDSSGAVVFEERVTDTASAGPVAGELRPGQTYRWSVSALTKDARNLRTPTSAFRMTVP